MDVYFYLLLYLMPFALLFPACITISAQSTEKTESTNMAKNGIIIGAILDCSSRVGKEERVAMKIAVEDLNNKQQMNLILREKCSHGEPHQAAEAARHLIIKNHVQAIVGPNSWEESSAAADVAQRFDIPILSLASSAPSWATMHWPSSFIQASPDTSSQMKAIAAIIQSWNWRRVNVIYEDRDSAPNYILNHLNKALEDSNVQTSGLLPLPSFVSLETLNKELDKLRKGACRVFLVHAGLEVAEQVFLAAKKLRMMERGYVWIATDRTMSLVHSINSSVLLSMQGVVGVRRYLSKTGHDNFHEFYVRFLEGFRKKYVNEKNYEPGTSAVQAYDATWAMGLAMSTAGSGQEIAKMLDEMDFDGLSGRIQFRDRKLAPIDLFQVINVGKSDLGLGFWYDGKGFSPVIDGAEGYSFSMEILGHVFWPGGPWSTPRGWEFPTVSNPLKIGVPNISLTNKFVRVEYDATINGYNFSGFSIEVFDKTVQNLNYSLPYQFVAFNGTYPDLVKKVGLKEFDAAVGDIAIISRRYDYVEFSHAHTESGLVMVVPIQAYSSKAWLFVKPFTKAMWLLTGFINIYNGFVVWSIERNYCSELRGPFLNQIGQLLWLAFARLLSLNGERLHSNLSKMATVVWLFVCLILTQSYTASLSSMLTVQRIEPKFSNIETLKSENKFIGCSKMSFVRSYLTDVLHYNANNIKNFTTPEAYAEAFKSGAIEAAFLEAPVAKLFIAKYCKSFIIAGPTYKVGGYGFAFQKGSPLLPDIDKALLNVFENGEAKDLEKNLMESEECMDIQVDNENGSLSAHSFFVLFVLSGSTSTAALAIYYFRPKRKMEHSIAEHKGVWVLILMVLGKLTKNQRNRMSRKVSDVESPRANSPHSSV